MVGERTQPKRIIHYFIIPPKPSFVEDQVVLPIWPPSHILTMPQNTFKDLHCPASVRWRLTNRITAMDKFLKRFSTYFLWLESQTGHWRRSRKWVLGIIRYETLINPRIFYIVMDIVFSATFLIKKCTTTYYGIIGKESLHRVFLTISRLPANLKHLSLRAEILRDTIPVNDIDSHPIISVIYFN